MEEGAGAGMTSTPTMATAVAAEVDAVAAGRVVKAVEVVVEAMVVEAVAVAAAMEVIAVGLSTMAWTVVEGPGAAEAINAAISVASVVARTAPRGNHPSLVHNICWWQSCSGCAIATR